MVSDILVFDGDTEAYSHSCGGCKWYTNYEIYYEIYYETYYEIYYEMYYATPSGHSFFEGFDVP